MRKYKLFGKIPYFDIIVILLVVAIAFVCLNVYKTSRSGNELSSTETKTIRYTIDFYNLSELIDGVPEIGEKIYDHTTNSEMGRVVAAEVTPFVAYSYNEITGEPTSTVYDDRVTISLTVEAKATVSDRATEINSIKIGIGKNMTFNMPSLCASGVIKNIEEVVG